MLNKTKKTEFIGLRCTKNTYEKLELLSEKWDRSISWIVDKAITEFLEREVKGDIENSTK